MNLKNVSSDYSFNLVISTVRFYIVGPPKYTVHSIVSDRQSDQNVSPV